MHRLPLERQPACLGSRISCGARRFARILSTTFQALAWIVLSLNCLGAAQAQEQTPRDRRAPQRLVVQLSWTHQAEFAGFYLAEAAKYFEQEGLDVVLREGNAFENPIDAVKSGKADVAISTLRGAMKQWDPARPVTHVAQIFQSSPIVLMCRPSLGVLKPPDILGKTIGVSAGGDADVLRAIVTALDPAGEVKTVPRDGTGSLLVRGEAACITGVTFNELLRVQGAGVPPSDLVVIRPESVGVTDIGDGLYVASGRLQSDEFRRQLTGLLRALEKGWRDARRFPSRAVAATLVRAPSLDATFQRQALEQVLELIPEEDFGLLQPGQAQAMETSLIRERMLQSFPEAAWTHRIWQDWRTAEGKARALAPATRHSLIEFSHNPIFEWAVTIGTLMFGLGGALLGIERGYNVWGRLIVAVLPALGGGILRDTLIGGPRLPLYLIADPTLPIALMVIVLVTSALVSAFPDMPKSRQFVSVKRYSDAIGAAVIATNGAVVALVANVPWIWAPVFAAISCAGGGLLMDIVTNRDPRAFGGRPLEAEELGMLSGLVLLGVLWVANHQERPELIVCLGSALAVAVNLAARYYRPRIRRIYPRWLAARGAARE